MSKLLTVTLTNDVSDTLERYMRALNANLPDGLRISKSNYVTKCIRKALEAEGVAIVADKMIDVPLPPIVHKPKLPPL